MKAWVAAAVSIAIAASIAVAPSASADQGSVDGTQPVLAMAAYTTCAIRESGQVYCWGNNENGELGRGNTAPSPYVAPVSGLTAAIGIYGDVWAFCALLEDRTVRCWGYGGSGTLGDGLGTSSFVPVTVSGLNHVTSVAIGYGAACATKQDGSVWCWGARTGPRFRPSGCPYT